MALKVNYAGLYKAQNRDRKHRKRRKLDMVEDGRSTKLLDKLSRERIIKAQNEDVPDIQRRQ